MSKRMPTKENVAQIILEEMTKWSPNETNVDKRREDLFELCERLIRYFTLFEVIPDPKTDPVGILPGLPGGKPL